MSDQRRPPVLITDIINQASSQLREAGIETPEHDAKLLLAEAAGVELRDVDRALLMGEELGTTGQLAVFRAMLDRRAKREPLQYITGHAPFRYLDLKVGPGVFIPRPETETVVQAGLDWLTKNGMIHPCVVDLCAVRCQRGARQPGVGGGAVAEHRRMDAKESVGNREKVPIHCLELPSGNRGCHVLRHIGPIGRHRRYRHHQSPLRAADRYSRAAGSA